MQKGENIWKKDHTFYNTFRWENKALSSAKVYQFYHKYKDQNVERIQKMKVQQHKDQEAEKQSRMSIPCH